MLIKKAADCSTTYIFILRHKMPTHLPTPQSYASLPLLFYILSPAERHRVIEGRLMLNKKNRWLLYQRLNSFILWHKMLTHLPTPQSCASFPFLFYILRPAGETLREKRRQFIPVSFKQAVCYICGSVIINTNVFYTNRWL